MGGCCKLILAWWYVHLSDLPSSPLRLCTRSFCFVRAVTHALRDSSFLCLDAFLHALHSFMYHIHSCVVLTHVLHIFMRRSCVVPIHALHLFMCHLRSCARCVVSATQLGACLTCSSRHVSSLRPPGQGAPLRSRRAREHVHKIHCWLPQLLFSLVLIA